MGYSFRKCSSCGADLNIESDSSYVFCQYCGTRIDSGSSYQVFEHVEHVVDDAEIKKIEIATKNLEKQKASRKKFAIACPIALVVGILLYKYSNREPLMQIGAMVLVMFGIRFLFPAISILFEDVFKHKKKDYYDELQQEINRLDAEEDRRKNPEKYREEAREQRALDREVRREEKRFEAELEERQNRNRRRR